MFERANPHGARGAGIITHPEMRATLTELGIDTDRDFGVGIARRFGLGRSCEIHATRPCAQTATSWNRLFAKLAAAFGPARYHLGKDLRHIHQTNEDNSARFANGTRATGHLLVGADGFRSAVRTSCCPVLDHALPATGLARPRRGGRHPAPLSAVVHLIGEPFLQPIYDRESNAMVQGRTALIGDVPSWCVPMSAPASSKPRRTRPCSQPCSTKTTM